MRDFLGCLFAKWAANVVPVSGVLDTMAGAGRKFCCWWCAGQTGDGMMVDRAAVTALGQGD
ncbi:hypothetical protein SLEP1_g24441 [Rubroshorea leprosula]|uniref:Uncharacterized protein n=1 Tax=Rubroshorea leprosula TaxID=152421 RepID=A0AAV5JR87_9ROSI|nr:hypothetical protein SLEP1_g24441 [Rubroshorea leprosula]